MSYGSTSELIFCGLTEQSAWVWVEAVDMMEKAGRHGLLLTEKIYRHELSCSSNPLSIDTHQHPLEAALAIIFVNLIENFSHFVFLLYRIAKLSLRVWKKSDSNLFCILLFASFFLTAP